MDNYDNQNNQINQGYNPNTNYNQGNQPNQNNGYYQNADYNQYNSYNQPNPNYQYQNDFDYNSVPMTLGDWLKTLLLMLIPVANIILLFIWAFSSNVNKNKKTFSQAYLIFMAIGFVLSIVFFIFIAAVIGAAASSYGGYY